MQTDRARWSLLLCLCCVLVCVAGCEGGGTVPEDEGDAQAIREEAQKVFKNTGLTKGEQGERGDWSIVLALVSGEGHEQRAARLLRDIRGKGKVPGAYIEQRSGSSVVLYGRYESSQDEQAADDLEMLKSIEVDGQRPYALVFLRPPVSEFEALKRIGSMPEYSLLTAKRIHGDSAKYTLQIGMYGREDLVEPGEEDLKEVREKAEDAVRILRADGEEAYYIHGLYRSTVTVGLFDDSDFDPTRPGRESRELLEAKERHPLNLYNGAGIKERGPTGRERMQKSRLVRVPELPEALKDASRSDRRGGSGRR